MYKRVECGEEMKAKLTAAVVGTLAVMMALALPFGVLMALYTGNPYWFMLCGLFLVFFLS